MRPPDMDWKFFFQGLAWRIAVCMIALAALGASYWIHGDFLSASDSRQQQLAALDQQRTALAERLQAEKEFGSRFQSLQATGVIGGEQRLMLAQVLHDAASTLGFPYLRYAIGPRHAFQVPYPQPGQLAAVQATAVEVQMGLVHELDLLRLVDWLHEQAPGFFSVAGCSLERVAGHDGASGAGKANVAGTCTLRWYSIPLDVPSVTVTEVTG